MPKKRKLKGTRTAEFDTPPPFLPKMSLFEARDMGASVVASENWSLEDGCRMYFKKRNDKNTNTIVKSGGGFDEEDGLFGSRVYRLNKLSREEREYAEAKMWVVVEL